MREPRTRCHAFLLVAPLSLWAVGCTTGAWLARADADAARIQRRAYEKTLASRATDVQRPAEVEIQDPATRADAEPLLLDLAQTLELAVRGNRDYATELESLYLTALSLSGAQRTFSPRLTSILSYVFDDGRNRLRSEAGTASIGMSNILDTGGSLNVNASTGRGDVEGSAATYDSALSVRLVQPLLRGAGYEVSHNALIQAEREVIYATRDFELFREDFSIDVARRFYGLVQTRQQLENQRENLERAAYDRRKAEALFDVGRYSEVTVLRAKRQELNSKNALLSVQERFSRELEQFAIFLGLPPGTRIDVVDDPPEYVPVQYEMDSAVAVALANRLDLFNVAGRLQDAQRAVRIARNGLLPDMQVELGAGLVSDPSLEFQGQAFDESASAGVSISLPLDRLMERNSLRNAQISLDRAQRAHEQFRQDVAVTVRSGIRELTRRQLSVEITEQLIRGEEKNKRIAELQFERGEIDNRELVDAEQSLLAARNALIDERVNYEIARLRLLRNMGILFIDERGMWRE